MRKVLLIIALVAMAALLAAPAEAFSLKPGQVEINIIDATTLFTDVQGVMTPRMPLGANPADFPGYAPDALAIGDESRSVYQVQEFLYTDASKISVPAGVLTGLAYGLTLAQVQAPDPDLPVFLSFTGGVLELYYDPTPEASGVWNPMGDGNAASHWDDSAAVHTYPNVNQSGETLWLSAEFLPNANGWTQRTQLDPTDGAGGSVGLSYLKVTGGSQAHMFDTNIGTIPGTGVAYDMTLQFTILNPTNALYPSSAAASGGWQISSADPIRATVIPEPATLTLLGFGLAGIALARKRSRK